MLTASQSPLASASSMVAAVWNPPVQMTGSGTAKLFRDGLVYDLTWARAEKGLPRFVDAAGKTVPFKPGQIWFEVLSSDSPTTFESGVFSARFKAPKPLLTPTPTP